MAKTAAQTLITDLIRKMGLDSADATNARPDALRQLNISQKMICQDHSLSFLATSATVSLLSGNSTVAVPTTIDVGKAMTLGKVAGDGEIEYVPVDEWFRTRIDIYGEGAVPTEPTHYTIAFAASVYSFIFKPTNTSGGNLAVPYIAQALVTDMTDASNSYSILPEGWEDTLLLDHAEAELRRIMNEPQWVELNARVNDKKERLYSSYRTTKEAAMTDREQQERKLHQVKLADEA